jgi:hypothetical protein
MPYRPWMVLKKGLSGDARSGFRPFWIRRFLCKHTGRTVSVHPRFSHFFKRFLLSFVIGRIVAITEQGRTAYRESKDTGVSQRTLHRWCNSFSTSETTAKYACFSPSGVSSAGPSMASLLFNSFRRTGSGDVCRGAAMGMVRLWEGFSRSLY